MYEHINPVEEQRDDGESINCEHKVELSGQN